MNRTKTMLAYSDYHLVLTLSFERSLSLESGRGQCGSRAQALLSLNSDRVRGA